MHFHPRGTHYHLGIDVHKDESHVAVLDDDGEVDREIRVENANLNEVAEEYEGSQAATEATSNYYRGRRIVPITGYLSCTRVFDKFESLSPEQYHYTKTYATGLVVSGNKIVVITRQTLPAKSKRALNNVRAIRQTKQIWLWKVSAIAI